MKESFEEQMQRLEALTERMKAEDVSLEEMMSLYAQSQALAKEMHRALDEAELMVRELSFETDSAEDAT